MQYKRIDQYPIVEYIYIFSFFLSFSLLSSLLFLFRLRHAIYIAYIGRRRVFVNASPDRTELSRRLTSELRVVWSMVRLQLSSKVFKCARCPATVEEKERRAGGKKFYRDPPMMCQNLPALEYPFGRWPSSFKRARPQKKQSLLRRRCICLV